MPKVRRLTSAEMKKSPTERAALRGTPFPTPGFKAKTKGGLTSEQVKRANASSLARAQKSIHAAKTTPAKMEARKEQIKNSKGWRRRDARKPTRTGS